MRKSKYSEVKKIIKENFPKGRIKLIKEFPEGYNNVAYDVRIDDTNYVIKIIKLKVGTRVLKQNKIRKLVMSKFKDYPIAKLLKSDYTKKLIDRPYIILEKVKGKTVNKAYRGMNNKEEVFREIGELYGKLHTFKMKSYGELDLDLNLIETYNSWYLENCRKVKKLFYKIEEENLLSRETLKQYKDFFDSVKFLLKKEVGPRLCHGDSALSNIIVKRVGEKHVVSGLIDLELTRSSGTVQDLFKGIETPNRKLIQKEEIIEGYKKYGVLPKDWEKLVYLYHWMNFLGRLNVIEGAEWRNLSEEKTIKRKKKMRKDCLLNLRMYQKKLESTK